MPHAPKANHGAPWPTKDPRLPENRALSRENAHPLYRDQDHPRYGLDLGSSDLNTPRDAQDVSKDHIYHAHSHDTETTAHCNKKIEHDSTADRTIPASVSCLNHADRGHRATRNLEVTSRSQRGSRGSRSEHYNSLTKNRAMSTAEKIDPTASKGVTQFERMIFDFKKNIAEKERIARATVGTQESPHAAHRKARRHIFTDEEIPPPVTENINLSPWSEDGEADDGILPGPAGAKDEEAHDWAVALSNMAEDGSAREEAPAARADEETYDFRKLVVEFNQEQKRKEAGALPCRSYGYDTLDILGEAGEIVEEYQKGVGKIITRNPMHSAPAEPEQRTFVLRRFFLDTYRDNVQELREVFIESDPINDLVIVGKWRNNIVENTVQIVMSQIGFFKYNFDSRRYWLKPEDKSFLAESVLKLKDNVNGADGHYGLRSLFSSRLGSMKMDTITNVDLDAIEARLEAFTMNRLPSSSPITNSNSTSKDATLANGVTADTDIGGAGCVNVEPDDAKVGGELSLSRGSSSAEARPNPLRSATVAESYKETSRKLLYQSGEHVHRHDLVLVLRTDKQIEEGRFDEGDIFDGPFRIVQLPRTSMDLLFDEHADIPQEQLRRKIRLDLPKGSLGKHFVPICNVRPVFRCNAEALPNLTAEELYTFHRDQEPFTLSDNAKKDPSAIESFTFVSQLTDGHFAKVNYTAPDPLAGDDCYIVSKLRGKRIIRSMASEHEHEPMNDPVILGYLANGGELNECEMLVVQYRVHWAGWSSQDDSWEVAYQNIAAEFVQEWEQANPGVQVAVPDKVEGEEVEEEREGKKKGGPKRKRTSASSTSPLAKKKAKKLRKRDDVAT